MTEKQRKALTVGQRVWWKPDKTPGKITEAEGNSFIVLWDVVPEPALFLKGDSGVRHIVVEDPTIPKPKKSKRSPASWSKIWPTEPGLYWFYGWLHSLHQHHGMEPDYSLVSIRREDRTDILVYCTNNTFLRHLDIGDGVWTPVVLPDPPALEPTPS